MSARQEPGLAHRAKHTATTMRLSVYRVSEEPRGPSRSWWRAVAHLANGQHVVYDHISPSSVWRMIGFKHSTGLRFDFIDGAMSVKRFHDHRRELFRQRTPDWSPESLSGIGEGE